MKTGVIVGRFQIDRLHEGHIYLYNKVRSKCDRIILVLGKSAVSFTDLNPLPSNVRFSLIFETFKEDWDSGRLSVREIYDNPSDEKWSEELDNILRGFKNVTLYHSRDGFGQRYTGKHKVKEINSKTSHSSTVRRREIGNSSYIHCAGSEFRAGIIYAVENRFPTAYPTVDIAVIRFSEAEQFHIVNDTLHRTFFGKRELLLARKAGRDKYCFIGGFVDPSDNSLEAAADRELHEEVQGIQTHEFKYISSHKVGDFRYRGTKDGIMTSLFLTYMMGGQFLNAADDIVEVRWFDIQNFDMDVLSPHHHVLFESLKKYLKL